LRASGRWHSRGRRVVYCSPNPATALLEVLEHAEIDLEDVPVNFRYLEIEAPDRTSMEVVSGHVLERNWADDLQLTRGVGDEWLSSTRTALLKVPSTIVPATWNLLVNPRHADAGRIRIAHTYEHPLDTRLQHPR
jgi:RES domain-containing protein